MSRMVIEGGNPLQGEISINGAKNAILPIMAASVLTGSECHIYRSPDISDVRVMGKILQQLGGRVCQASDENRITIQVESLATDRIDADLMRQMRSSVLLTGPLLVRGGSAQMTYPGGCAIGPRPVDMHLAGFEQMGARVDEQGGNIRITVPDGRLRGSDIHLEYPSVGATENIMMAACGARGTTRIYNPAREPEIDSLADFLRKLGANISGTGSSVITIEGAKLQGGTCYELIPDRIEAGTYILAVAAAGGQVRINQVCPEHLQAFLAKVRQMGVRINQAGEGVLEITSEGRLRAVDVLTLPYPGYPTDLQNQFMAVACTACGTSVITETVFENRFKVADEFRRMGARIRTEGRIAVVKGVKRLRGTTVRANQDLRGAASLVLAALGAEGQTNVQDIEPVDRGYTNLAGQLRKLGADVVRYD